MAFLAQLHASHLSSYASVIEPKQQRWNIQLSMAAAACPHSLLIFNFNDLQQKEWNKCASLRKMAFNKSLDGRLSCPEIGQE